MENERSEDEGEEKKLQEKSQRSLSLDQQKDRRSSNHSSESYRPNARYGSFDSSGLSTSGGYEATKQKDNLNAQLHNNDTNKHIYNESKLPNEGLCYTNLALSYENDVPICSAKTLNENYRKDSDYQRKATHIFIQRDVFDQHEINEVFGKQPPQSDSILKQIGKCCKCNPLTFILNLFPVLVWLPKYNFKQNILNDIIAGFTVAVLQIPQGMAYGLLATVAAVNGLYVSFFPILIYFLMGTSRHISVGTFAIISVMLRNAADKLGAVYPTKVIPVVGNNSSTEQTLFSDAQDTDLWPPTRLEVVTSMAVACGLWQILMGVFRLGVLSIILSDRIISGFTTGAAVYVATTQLKDLFDISLPNRSGLLQVIYMYIDIFKTIQNTNLMTLAVSAVSIFIIAVVKEQVNERFRSKLKMPIPIDLAVVILATAVSYYAKFSSNYNVSVMGVIPTGLPTPTVPRLDLLPKVVLSSFSIAIVVFAITLSMAKLFAKKHNYEINANQELLALGSANLFASFFSCYPCATSLSRSLVQERAGGKSQLSGLVSCLFLLVVLLFFAPYFYHLPKCILSAVILVALKGMFLQFKDLWTTWRICRLDAVIWVVSFLAVIITTIDLGLLIGVLFSLFVLVLRLVFPNMAILGRIPNTDIYLNVQRYKECKEIKDIKIFHFGGSLCYLNTESFKTTLLNSIPKTSNKQINVISDTKLPTTVPQQISYLILDCSSFSFLDMSSVEVLSEVRTSLEERDIIFVLADCSVPVYERLEKGGYFAKAISHCVFPTLHDAVTYCQSNYNIRL